MSTAPETSYPRPDFVATNLNWQNLNGPWDFLFDDTDVGLLEHWHKTGLPNETLALKDNRPSRKRTIQVPFVFQSEASGINEQDVHEVLWYERTIEDIRTETEKQDRHRLLLRFGAVDYSCNVWVDGQYVGEHRGGHVPFDLDITEALYESSVAEHQLTVRVYDSANDLTQPRGKQYWGMYIDECSPSPFSVHRSFVTPPHIAPVV